MWLDILKQMKKESGKTSQKISDETGISKSTIDKLFIGRTKDPSLSQIRAIVHCLGYTLDDLTEKSNAIISVEDKKLLNKYHSLDQYGQEVVDKVIDVEHRRCESYRKSGLILTTVAARSENDGTKIHQEWVQDLSKFEPDNDNIDL